MTEFDLEKSVDEILSDRPDALKLRRDNRNFINKLETHKIKPEYETVKVFGVKAVNVNAILKDNIWNRSVFTTDKLCRLFLGCNLEQLKKYEKKKRTISFNIMWLLIIMFGVVIAVLVMVFLLPQLGVI